MLNKSKKRPLLCTLGILLCSAVGSATCSRAPQGSNGLKGFNTPEWKLRDGETLMVRSEEESGGALLLRCLTWQEGILREDPNRSNRADNLPSISVIYRYDPSKNSLSEVALKDWDAAKGVIIEKYAENRCFESAIGVDLRSRKVICNGKPIESSGKTGLSEETSLDCQLVAILSTTGSYSQPGMIFGGGGAKGQRFHEVFQRSDCSRVGQAVPLDYHERSDGLMATWTADGKYVIYTDADFTIMFIIPVE